MLVVFFFTGRGMYYFKYNKCNVPCLLFRYEKYGTSEGGWRYATVGFATVYRYYAYPCHMRPRISQVLTLPPFRKLGVCAELLQVPYTNIYYVIICKLVWSLSAHGAYSCSMLSYSL